jgi:CheY-like chemotaxis protein/anti-sigma regulatory factor (Ser/Thr protein kinase)
MFAARNHRLVLELPAPMMLNVDQVRLTQVISNLLANAAKYTDPGGTITLGCRLDSEVLDIYVRDNGFGLEPHRVDEIFEMFVQLRPVPEDSEGGLGIGLALVKALVELHGGSVHVHSAGPGQGSTFTVRLPRTALLPTSRPTYAPWRAKPQTARSVLIADDNIDGAEILAMLLQTSGHIVHVAHDGAAAMELAARLKPDVAVLDIGMPGLNGYEVAKRIRGEAWGSRVMLIALTGWGQEGDRSAALAAGFDHHLTKPTDPARLESLLATLN